MPIYYGGNKISEVYKDGTSIKELYNGSDLVFSSFTPATYRFDYTGDVQTFTVPSGCNKLIIDCVGAKGGDSDTGAAKGGVGGRVQCDMVVSGGQILYIYVGGAGIFGQNTYNSSWSGGYNGGAEGYQTVGSGGGATDIRIGGNTLNDRKLVAGGGGGAGTMWVYSEFPLNGGSGGGLIGGDGTHFNSAYGYSSGKGGTQSAGGNPSSNSGSTPEKRGVKGEFGIGGKYGGGGGYYGGGGGAYYGARSSDAAAGGSSYTDPDLCTNVVHTQGYSEATGNGWIIITTAK
jgi:hypothetical protein